MQEVLSKEYSEKSQLQINSVYELFSGTVLFSLIYQEEGLEILEDLTSAVKDVSL